MGYHFNDSIKVVDGKTLIIKERLEDIVRGFDLDFCEGKNLYKKERAIIIYDEITRNIGGVNHHECVFQINGTFYKTFYTEDSQYVLPYANEDTWIEVKSVAPKEVTVIKYV